jgi:hypothetical protein
VRKSHLLICSIVSFSLLSTQLFASGIQLGITLPILIKGKDPEGVHGYRAIAWYQPQTWIWPKFQIYLAGGFGHWWAHGAKTARCINIYSLAPVIRYYFKRGTYFSPFAEISIGASYLTKTHFSDRNLGIHYSFQDELGLGATFGKSHRYYFTLTALHYSNGSMASMNAGITVPVVLNIGYRFS